MQDYKIEWQYSREKPTHNSIVRAQPEQVLDSDRYERFTQIIEMHHAKNSPCCDVSPQEVVTIRINDSKINSKQGYFVKTQTVSKREHQNKIFQQADQTFYKTLILKRKLVIQEQQFQSGCESDRVDRDARSLRSNSIFSIRMRPLREFSVKRADRVKDSESVQFFRDIQMISHTDAASDIKCPTLLSKFPVIRQIRGDGNCLYSSVIFAYLEILLMQDDDGTQLNALINGIGDNSVRLHDIYQKGERVVLLPAEYSKILLLQFFGQLTTLQTTMHKKPFNKKIIFYHLNQLILSQANEINGLYDILVALIRSIALNSFNTNKSKEPFSSFICQDQEQELLERIETFEEEADYLILTLICEVLPIEVNILQWDTLNVLTNMQQIKSPNQISIIGSIYLKYVPEHYDLVYTSIQHLQWFLYHTTFEYLQDGYCMACEDLVEGKSLRLKTCAHSFCLSKQHLTMVGSQFKCPQCSVTFQKSMMNDFLTLSEAEISIFEPIF